MFFFSATRIGVVIIVIHNLSEVIVCYAKIVLYLSFVRQAVIGFSMVVVCRLSTSFSFPSMCDSLRLPGCYSD